MLFSSQCSILVPYWQKGKVLLTTIKKRKKEEIAARGKVKSKWEWRYVSGANWWEGREREGVSVGLLTGEEGGGGAVPHQTQNVHLCTRHCFTIVLAVHMEKEGDHTKPYLFRSNQTCCSTAYCAGGNVGTLQIYHSFTL